MAAPPGNNHNPKGNPQYLNRSGSKVGDAKRVQAWEGLTDEQWEDLCGRISNGESAVRIIGSEFDVAHDTFLKWVRRAGKEEEYHAAFMARVDAMRFEVLDIADDQESDVYIDSEGKEQTNHNVIQRAKLRVDTRWRILTSLDSRFKPKQEIEHSGVIDNPSALTDEERANRVAALFDAARARRDGQATNGTEDA